MVPLSPPTSTRRGRGLRRRGPRPRSSVERRGPLEKGGVFTGAHAVNPFTEKPVPVYLADYVLMGYGTGAIMAVPGQDQRDWDFAKAPRPPIIRTVQPPDDWEGEAYTGDGPVPSTASGSMASRSPTPSPRPSTGSRNGASAPHRQLPPARLAAVAAAVLGLPDPDRLLPRHGTGPRARRPAARAAPDDVEFRPTGESPLRFHEGFLHTTCPMCGGPPAETDTMDTFVDSSWYFLRFADPWNHTPRSTADHVAAWLPVDQYIGGIEHAILHLMYARFFTKALADSASRRGPCASPSPGCSPRG